MQTENLEAEKAFLSEVTKRLCEHHDAKKRGRSLCEIKCRGCGKKTAWTSAEAPLKIRCNRINQCGGEYTHADYFPGLQSEIYKQFRPKNPTERALNYARYNRGITHFEKWGGIPVHREILGERVDALEFRLTGGSKESFNFRLINHSQNNSCTWGDKSASMWIPATETDFSKAIVVAESPIKAMGILESGVHQAVSVLSAGCKPENKTWLLENKDKFTCLIIGFDNDRAGHAATKIWVAWCKENKVDYEIAFPVGGDWDDMHKNGALTEETFSDCLLEGSLFEAESASDAAKLIEGVNGYCPPVIEWKGATYKVRFGEIQTEGGAEPCVESASEIISGVLRGSHTFYGYDFENEVKSRHYLTYIPRNYRIKTQTFLVTGHDLSSAQNLEKKMYESLSIPFEGSRKDIAYIMQKIVRLEKCPRVYQYDRLGYHPKTGSYVFQYFAVTRDGRVINRNDKGYFDEINVAPMSEKEETTRHTREAGSCNLAQVMEHIYNAWGTKGILTTGYYVATLFSSAVTFPHFRFHPHLSLNGKRNCGKSMLTALHNRLFSLEDREGYPLKPTSTAKSYNRILAGKNSLPVVLLEGNEARRMPIAENDLLSLYNREAAQTRANKSQDNSINQLDYDAGLIMVQNNEWFKQGAVKERFVSIFFEDKQGIFSAQEKLSYNALMSLTPEQCAGFGLMILKNRGHFENRLLPHIKRASERLLETGLQNDRVRNNHAIALGGITCLLEFIYGGEIPYKEEIIEYTRRIAGDKLGSSENLSDNVTHFFNAFEELIKPPRGCNMPAQLQHGIHYLLDEGIVYIRLTQTLAVIDACGYRSVDSKALAEELRLNDCYVGEFNKKHKSWGQKRTFALSRDGFLSSVTSVLKRVE